jgi:hypothetical protein
MAVMRVHVLQLVNPHEWAAHACAMTSIDARVQLTRVLLVRQACAAAVLHVCYCQCNALHVRAVSVMSSSAYVADGSMTFGMFAHFAADACDTVACCQFVCLVQRLHHEWQMHAYSITT